MNEKTFLKKIEKSLEKIILDMKPILFEYEFKRIQGLPGIEVVFSEESSLKAIIIFVTPPEDSISEDELFGEFEYFDVFRVAGDFFHDKIGKEISKERLKEIFEEMEAKV